MPRDPRPRRSVRAQAGACRAAVSRGSLHERITRGGAATHLLRTAVGAAPAAQQRAAAHRTRGAARYGRIAIHGHHRWPCLAMYVGRCGAWGYGALGAHMANMYGYGVFGRPRCETPTHLAPRAEAPAGLV